LRLFDRRDLMLEVDDALAAVGHCGISLGGQRDCRRPG
jgi:hypothetical protein